MNNRNKRPGSFGAFLLAVYTSPNEEAVKAEVKRAQDAGCAASAVESILKRLTTAKLWIRTHDEVRVTKKGLHYLRRHGLIEAWATDKSSKQQVIKSKEN